MVGGISKSVRAATGVGCRRKKMKMRSSLIAPVAVAFDREITADVYHKVAASVGEPRAAEDSAAGLLRNHSFAAVLPFPQGSCMIFEWERQCMTFSLRCCEVLVSNPRSRSNGVH